MRNIFGSLGIITFFIHFMLNQQSNGAIQDFTTKIILNINNVDCMLSLLYQLSKENKEYTSQICNILHKELNNKLTATELLSLGLEFTKSLEKIIYEKLQIECKIYISLIELI